MERHQLMKQKEQQMLSRFQSTVYQQQDGIESSPNNTV